MRNVLRVKNASSKQNITILFWLNSCNFFNYFGRIFFYTNVIKLTSNLQHQLLVTTSPPPLQYTHFFYTRTPPTNLILPLLLSHTHTWQVLQLSYLTAEFTCWNKILQRCPWVHHSVPWDATVHVSTEYHLSRRYKNFSTVSNSQPWITLSKNTEIGVALSLMNNIVFNVHWLLKVKCHVVI